jgi:hypothetical protein
MSTSSIPQHREAAAWVPLLLEVLNRQGHCRWPLRGHSMRPTLPADCEIDVAPLPTRVPLGALIVFANGDALVAHRLVRRAGNAWIAQGDNRRSPDRALNPAQVLGVVRAAYLPNQQQCWPSTFSGALAWFWIARYHMLRVVRFTLRTVYHGRPRG